jgi:hypothetical protein
MSKLSHELIIYVVMADSSLQKKVAPIFTIVVGGGGVINVSSVGSMSVS